MGCFQVSFPTRSYTFFSVSFARSENIHIYIFIYIYVCIYIERMKERSKGRKNYVKRKLEKREAKDECGL